MTEEQIKIIQSEEFKTAVENALKEARKDIEKLKKARKVNPEVLRRPFTI